MKERRILKATFLLAWLLVVANTIAEYFSLYWTLKWFDLVTHFIGGVLVALIAVWLWFYSRYFGPVRLYSPRPLLLVTGLSVMSVAVLWEVYERFVWYLTDYPLAPNYVSDTVLDIVLTLCGATLVFLVLARPARKERT